MKLSAFFRAIASTSRTNHTGKDSRYSLTLAIVGVLTLALCVLIYAISRDVSPWFFSIWTDGPYGQTAPLVSLPLWLPSAAHAFGCTCLLAVCWRGTSFALFVSGFFWFAANALWEWFCHSSVEWAQRVLSMFSITCTFDTDDILAAGLGAFAPLFFVSFFNFSRCQYDCMQHQAREFPLPHEQAE